MELDANLKCRLIQSIRQQLSTAGRPEGTLYRGLSDVIKPPMDVGTVVNRLKRGLYGLVRGLLLDVELFMANATRSISPPAAVEGGDLLPMYLGRHCGGRRRRPRRDADFWWGSRERW
jgi:hypothetical protein